MTTWEAAKQSGLNEGAVKSAIRTGHLVAVKESQLWRGRLRWQIRPEDFVAWRQEAEARDERSGRVGKQIADLRRAGMKIDQIAQELGCCRRTVFRWLSRPIQDLKCKSAMI